MLCQTKFCFQFVFNEILWGVYKISHCQHRKLVELILSHSQWKKKQKKQWKNFKWIWFSISINPRRIRIYKSIVCFCGWSWWGVTKLLIFCGRHNCMIPNGMFLNLGVSWLESLGSSLIFVIYNFLDSFELKIKLLIAFMSLMVSDETKKVFLFVYNW